MLSVIKDIQMQSAHVKLTCEDAGGYVALEACVLTG